MNLLLCLNKLIARISNKGRCFNFYRLNSTRMIRTPVIYRDRLLYNLVIVSVSLIEKYF